MTGSRYQHIDETRAVGILMVVTAHICNASGLSNPVRDWFNPFMLGLFFMISGYLHFAGRNREDSFSSFLSRKIKSLAVPYLFFSVLAAVLQTAAAYEKQIPVSVTLKCLAVDFFTLKGFGPIWFLPVMFFAEAGFYLVIRRSRTVHGLAFAGALLVTYGVPGLIHSLVNAEGNQALGNYAAVAVKAAAGIGVMLAGYYILPCMDRLKKRYSLGLAALCGFAVSVAVSRIYNLDLNNLDFGWCPVLFFVDSVFGTIFAAGCCRLLDTVHPCGFLSYIGRNSLIILCTHTELYLVQVVTAGWMQAAGQAAVVGERYYAEILIKLILVVVAETGLIELIRRYCPFIPGAALNQ